MMLLAVVAELGWLKAPEPDPENGAQYETQMHLTVFVLKLHNVTWKTIPAADNASILREDQLVRSIY